MDRCLTDLMDWGEQINLPAFMIKHIARIATTPRAHDLGYGFLLTRVFEYFALIKAGDRSGDQGVQTPPVPVPRPTQH